MSRALRLSRPVYEALPWIYVLSGLAALVASYFSTSRLVSLILGLPGLLAVVGGIVVMLRRKDFRRMRAEYVDTDSSVIPREEE